MESEHAKIWDFPNWTSPLTIAGFAERCGVGYFPMSSPVGAALVCDNAGKLYLNPQQELTPSRDSHADWAVQVSNQNGLAVYVPVPARNMIKISGLVGAYLPVAKILKDPMPTF